ncbi:MULTISPECIES: hypothetical protein [Gibbsiella]|nr:hypothetical protein [Gibbsiella quercinecans]
MKNIHHRISFLFCEIAMAQVSSYNRPPLPALLVGGPLALKQKKQTLV